MTVKRDITKSFTAGKDEKEVLHCEFDLRGSDLVYTSGDALGIYPLNNPPEVDSLLRAIGSRGTGKKVIEVPQTYAPSPEGKKQSAFIPVLLFLLLFLTRTSFPTNRKPPPFARCVAQILRPQDRQDRAVEDSGREKHERE